MGLYISLRDLASVLERELETPGFIAAELGTAVGFASDSSPYQEFMTRANGTMKLARLRLYNALLAVPSVTLAEAWGNLWSSQSAWQTLEGLGDFTKMSLYTDGVEKPLLDGGDPEYFNFFEAMQFPEFPHGEDRYLAEDEYFLMGDNRYNSVDSRLGRQKREVYLDPRDKGVFSESVDVTWDGHAIPRKNIQGRVRAILFPFTRLKLF